MMYRIIIAFTILFMSSCIYVLEDEYVGYTYESAPYIYDAGWECQDNGFFDDWTFWAIAEDSSGYYDLSYLFVRAYSLIDSGATQEINERDNVNGYYSIHRTYYTLQCGDPIDVEYTIVDYNNNSDSYMLYW